jgi:chloramphenicol 3-O-phosphotransferase
MISKKIIVFSLLTITTLLISQQPPVNNSKIIVLHGCSSSGKSSVAQQLQNLYADEDKPFFYLPMDTFLSMLPKKWLNLNPHDNDCPAVAEDGLQFAVHEGALETPIIKIIIGKTVINTAHAMTHCLHSLAQNNNNVIFEGAFPCWLFDDIEQLKQTHTIHIINIQCDLATMEAREIQRNGLIGLTRSQYQDPEYRYGSYDYIVNTSHQSPSAAAQEVKAFIDNQK